MKTLVRHSALFALVGLVLSPLAVVHASPPPPDSVPFCAPFDSEQWQRDRLRPAGKRLVGLNVGEPRTVRLIYFIPNDRTPQQDIDAKMDELIKNVQLSYEEMMEYHGFGARTFALETDATGKAVVHHVKGKFNDEYYHTDTGRKVIDEETAEQFDLSANVYLVVLDVSDATIDGYCGIGGSWGPEGGMALIPAPNSARQRERGWSCFNVDVTAHEVGHAFGLAHDHFRNATRSPSSYTTDWMVTSFCAAEWLDAHRYFNRGQTYPQADEPTTIQMLPPLAVPPNAIRLRFEVTDPDGLHQAQLHNSTGEAIDCQGLDLDGESASVEFVTPEATEGVTLRVVDVYGNVTEQWQPIDITALLPPEVISIPDANLAAVVREALDLAPGDAISQLDMLRLGGLEANGRQITDLTGLEYAVNLKGLNLGDNQISDITSLAESTILEGLELYNNNISDISSLADMNNLTSLYLYGNSVSDLSPLTESINLHELTLGDNSVSDLSPLAGLIHLVRLELYDNNISDISSLAAMTHLTFLPLGDNSVSDLSPLERLTNLKELDLWDNSVSDLSPLAGLTNLKELYLWYNSVSDLSPLAELNDLTNLEIVGNLVSDLSPLVANTGLGDGDVVDVQDNPLSYASIHTHIPILLERGVTVNHDNRAHPALLKISGYNQQGASGETLAQPFVVAVQDENGSAVEGVQVTFTVTEGGGTLSSTTSTTDANGQAATTLTLGSQPGPNTVAATVEGLEPETFTAIGRATTESDGEEATGEEDGEVADDESSGESQAWLMPDPAEVEFYADDPAWKTFTVHTNLDSVLVRANPSGSDLALEVAGGQQVPTRDYCPAEGNDRPTRGRRDGYSLHVKACQAGRTKLLLIDYDTGEVLQQYEINVKIIDKDSAGESQAWLMPDPAEVEFYADDPAWKTFTVHTTLDSVLVRANPSGSDPALEVAGGQQVPTSDYCPAEGNDRPTRGRRDGWSLHVKACQAGRTKILLIDYDTDAVLQQYEINVEASTSASATTALNPSYPNPFNSETVLSYTLPTASDIRLEVFALNGQRVAVLHEGFQAAGYHTIAMDASDLASGVYLYRLTTPEGRFVQKFTLLR